MKRLRFTSYLLQPSVSSLLLTILGTIVILTASTVAYSRSNGFLYQVLLGPESSVQLIQTSQDAVAAFNNTVLGNPVINTAMFGAFWIIVAIVTYFTVAGIGTGVVKFGRHMKELHYANMRKLAMEQDATQRTLMRTLALMAWFTYSVVFFKFFLPSSILSTRIGLNQLGSPSGYVFLIFSLSVLGIGLHLHIVLLRLFLLQPRVIGGWDVIGESDHANH